VRQAAGCTANAVYTATDSVANAKQLQNQCRNAGQVKSKSCKSGASDAG
jgi:hypothetical protein